jgi:hypothetical protein
MANESYLEVDELETRLNKQTFEVPANQTFSDNYKNILVKKFKILQLKKIKLLFKPIVN